MAADQGGRLSLVSDAPVSAPRSVRGSGTGAVPSGDRRSGGPSSDRRRKPLVAALPAFVWMLLFFALPLVIFAVYSLMTAGLYEVSTPFTTDAYSEALSDPLNRTLARNSLVVGLATGAVCVLVGLPIAYWLRFVAGRSRLIVLFLITASMFASYLVRIYAWRTVLGSEGVINGGLDSLGLIDQPLDFLLYNRIAVVIALVHIFLPFVVLVLYAAMTPISDGLLEAGQDLGAGAGLLWRRVVVPIMAAPCWNAFVFVFVLAASDYVTPQFLGGREGTTLGVRIQAAFITVGDWPLAAATSFLMLGSFVLLYVVGAFVLRRLRLHDVRLAT